MITVLMYIKTIITQQKQCQVYHQNIILYVYNHRYLYCTRYLNLKKKTIGLCQIKSTGFNAKMFVYLIFSIVSIFCEEHNIIFAC